LKASLVCFASCAMTMASHPCIMHACPGVSSIQKQAAVSLSLCLCVCVCVCVCIVNRFQVCLLKALCTYCVVTAFRFAEVCVHVRVVKSFLGCLSIGRGCSFCL